jgi:DNA-directed RNA polymerase specialized sigma24 family protein
MDTTAPLYPIEDVLRQSEWITRLARRLVTDRDDADAQETIIAAARPRPETDRPLRPWLRKVAQNFARRGQRGAGRRRRREEEALAHAPTFPAPDELLERAQMQRQVAALVFGLDEP